MRRACALAIVCVAVGTLLVCVVYTARNATAIHNNRIQPGDVNDDGRITFLGDAIPVVKMSAGLLATPTPIIIPPPLTATDIATVTATASPTPVPVGGGNEAVLARGLIIPPDTTMIIGSIDPTRCVGAVFYVAARTVATTRSTYVNAFVNGRDVGQLQVDANWTFFLVHDFNIGGTGVLGSQLNWGSVNPTQIAIRVNASLGLSVEVNADAHCQPNTP